MIIITGGTYGIGRACVELLAPRGVVFTGRDEAAGEALAARFDGAHFVPGDVAKELDIRRVVETALERGSGRLSGLVNNAGMSRRISFVEATSEDWDLVMNVNARSTFLFTRWALAGLRAGKGSVVNIASIAGWMGEEGLAVYCASKAAVIAMTSTSAQWF